MLVRENNYILVQSFMVTELGLKGNTLLVYAIIFGFSQDGASCFNGSRKYLAEWTNSTVQGIDKCLKYLVDNKYIEKIETYQNGVKFCKYKSLYPVNKVYRDSKQSLHNNIDNNIDNNIHTSEHKSYGEYHNVYLTDKQKNAFECLVMNKEKAAEIIDSLSASIASNRDKVFDENFPEMHFIRLKVYWQNYKKRPRENKKETNIDVTSIINALTEDNENE